MSPKKGRPIRKQNILIWHLARTGIKLSHDQSDPVGECFGVSEQITPSSVFHNVELKAEVADQRISKTKRDVPSKILVQIN